MRKLTISIGGRDPARILRRWTGSWEEFVKSVLAKVKETEDKASAGWVCGAEFAGAHRHGDEFVNRQIMSLDYDHISPAQFEDIRARVRDFAHLAYTTASHTLENPRLRVWLPFSRPCGDDEFRAVCRRFTETRLGGVGLAAAESYRPAQIMFLPSYPQFGSFEHWENLEGAWADVDSILTEYVDWTDRTSWPGFDEGTGERSDALSKPGLIGAWNRAFSIEEAIERFELPYDKVR